MPHTSISPMLSVRRGAEAVEFYKSAFGAEVLYRVDAPDGEVVARLSTDGAEFWVADESPEHKNFSPDTLGGGTVRMVMIVDNPDAVFAKAIAAGAMCVWPVGKSTWLASWESRRSVRTSLGDRQTVVLIDTAINLFGSCSVNLTPYSWIVD
jgi:PhnB protein